VVRYYDRMNEAQDRGITAKNIANASIPIPVSRPAADPEPEPAAAPDGLTAYADAPLESQTGKKVRVVGETFLPEN
jgi:hypothetical protein